MTFAEYKYLILSDLYRIINKNKISKLIWHILWGESYKYIFWMRTCHFTQGIIWLKCSIYPLAHFMLNRYRISLAFASRLT